MRTYPIPFNDPARLAALRNLPGLDASSEPLFEKLTDAARNLLGCPVAHISLVEEETQWFKAVVGVDLPVLPRDQSFCTHTIMSDDFLVVPDLSADPRFVDHPMVAHGPKVRFYAGAPIILSSGFRIGSLCALDFNPHDMPAPGILDALRALTDAVGAALERRPETRQVAAKDRARGQAEFTALIGHELRTPLTKIFSYSRFLEAQVTGAPQRFATGARSSCEHLMGLIETIITFTDASTGDLSLNEGTCDLGQIITEALAIQGPDLSSADKAIMVLGLDLPGPMRLDANQIKLALSALIENALLHGGDALTLSAGVGAGGHVEIVVTDNGRLDTTLQIHALYEPFVVGGDLDTRKVGGLGLGLPLTRKLVELHGGEIEVRDDGDRTVATIRLPAWRLQAGIAQVA
ncbi:GAF domain-containing sensor histidine kinase [Frigidibacter sp. MR17.14]|uniref:GAF domain-containing sensor histidine kinase n=1 Tax=Frigidibacter sp. MR17.14 TaxID=3126509 RepID=UPI0030130CB8